MTAKEFLHGLPAKAPAGSLEGIDTNFHFDISGDGGGQFAVVISDGQMMVHDTFEGQESCKITASNDNFVKVLKGELNPMMAVMTGKVKISNQGELLKYAKFFGLM